MTATTRRQLCRIIVAACGLGLLCGRSLSAQWEVSSIGVETLWGGIDFIDDSVGIVVGTDVIARTTDQGRTWTFVDTTTFDGIQLEDVVCDTTVVGPVCITVGSRLSVGRSVDGGLTWNLVNQEFSASLTGVNIVDSVSFVAVGIGGWAARTEDTGLTWDSNLIFPQADLYDVTLHPDGNLWAAGFQVQGQATCCGVILKSSDLGATWQTVHTMPNNAEGRTLAIHFFDDREAVALTSGSVFSNRSGFWRSTDGGENWVREGIYSPMLAMDFAGDSVGIMVGEQGVIYKTLDRGATWEQQENRILATYSDVIMLDENTALAVAGGVIIRNRSFATTGMDDDTFPREALKHWVYPNAATSVATIVFETGLDHSGDARIRITDILGRLVDERRPADSGPGRYVLRVSTNDMPAGLYFYAFEGADRRAGGRFVVIR